ncbi:hypothetical protein [uncultured Paracoccus sp.]|uniref:hypothetical protein n=1 Tax=uncultured Paracoccus sp. TaxID=189685 RepID=UPI002611F06E|nr:hypothetical protein [uncultured Paracoccus sp.]
MTQVASHEAADERTSGSASMRGYVLALVAGALLVLAGLGTTLAVLSARGTLPPPQFSNSLCMDEKLRAMRDSPPQDPDLLVVGSSVAWRHFNSPAAAAAQPGLRPYNAGLCGASIAQTEVVVDWLADRLSSVERILLIASPRDFENCGGDQPSRFDVAAVDRYVFQGAWPLRYYLRYFDPPTFARNVRAVRENRGNLQTFDALVFNEFGDGPIEPPQDRGLLYGDVTIDPVCYSALRRIAVGLDERDVQFDVAMTPLHPEWLRTFDGDGKTTGAIDSGIREASAGTGASLLRADPQLGPAAFFDAIHIRWSQTDEFTRALLD